jgi:hypothetical protein
MGEPNDRTCSADSSVLEVQLVCASRLSDMTYETDIFGC